MLTKWFNTLYDINKQVLCGTKFHRHMALAFEQVVSKITDEANRTKLTSYVQAEHPLLIQLLAIVACYTDSPDKIFEPLCASRIFKSSDFYIGWSDAFVARGNSAKARQVVRRGIEASRAEKNLLRSRFNVLKSNGTHTDCYDLLMNGHETRFNELCEILVKTIIKSVSGDSIPRAGSSNITDSRVSTSVRPCSANQRTAMVFDERNPTRMQLVNDLSDFEIFIPTSCRRRKTWSSIVSCPGCSKKYPKEQRHYHHSYYYHCLKRCNQYKRLGM